MTNEQAINEIKKRIEKVEESAAEKNLAKEFWEPTMEVYQAALVALEYTEAVRKQTLPSYAEVRGRNERRFKMLAYMELEMTVAEIEEMLEGYLGEPITTILGDAVSEYEQERQNLEEKRLHRQLNAEYEGSVL